MKTNEFYEDKIKSELLVIRDITGRTDLEVTKTKYEGWRLTGLYPDGSRASVGGLGVVQSAKDFYNLIYGFARGLVAMKRWASVQRTVSNI